jgi:type I restriction enzyme S subunit
MYASLGKVALLDIDAVVNQAILGIVPRKHGVARDFLRWWLEFMQAHVPMLSSSNTQDNLNADKVRNMPVFVPEHSEQRAIAAFLDRETALIDALVQQKETLITLLEEQLLTLIAHTTKHGLDHAVDTKESGVAWFGRIPRHWTIAPVYSRYEVALGKMLDAKKTSGVSLGRYLRNIDVQWSGVNTADLPQMDFATHERARYLLRLGDLLVCEGGEVGRTAVWRDGIPECYYQKAIHRVRPLFGTEMPRYFYYIMYALAKQGVFAASGNANTIDHLTAVQLSHYRFPFPPTEEQSAIAAFLDREASRVASLIARVRGAIEQLRELRSAMVAAAVTGRIDVRDHAA